MTTKPSAQSPLFRLRLCPLARRRHLTTNSRIIPQTIHSPSTCHLLQSIDLPARCKSQTNLRLSRITPSKGTHTSDVSRLMSYQHNDRQRIPFTSLPRSGRQRRSKWYSCGPARSPAQPLQGAQEPKRSSKGMPLDSFPPPAESTLCFIHLERSCWLSTYFLIPHFDGLLLTNSPLFLRYTPQAPILDHCRTCDLRPKQNHPRHQTPPLSRHRSRTGARGQNASHCLRPHPSHARPTACAPAPFSPEPRLDWKKGSCAAGSPAWEGYSQHASESVKANDTAAVGRGECQPI